MMSNEIVTTSNQQEMKECSYCSELVIASAKKCKHCGEILDPTMRELDFLKNQKQNVFMNAGGGGSSSSSSASSSSSGGNVRGGLRQYPWGWHLFFSIITAGWWIIGWVACYFFRDKSRYY
jgi:hypothetical protein